MLDIDDEKFPPPTPATAATASSVPNETPGSRTTAASARRDEQQRRADDRPVAAPELGHGERVRDPRPAPRRASGPSSGGTSARRRSRTPGRGTARTPTTCSRRRSRRARRGSRTPGCVGRRGPRWSPRTPGPRDASRRSSGPGRPARGRPRRAGRRSSSWGDHGQSSMSGRFRQMDTSCTGPPARCEDAHSVGARVCAPRHDPAIGGAHRPSAGGTGLRRWQAGRPIAGLHPLTPRTPAPREAP